MRTMTMKANEEKGRIYVILDDGTLIPLDTCLIVREMLNDYACVKSEWLIKAVYKHYIISAYELFSKEFINLHDYERIVNENLRLYKTKMNAYGY